MTCSRITGLTIGVALVLTTLCTQAEEYFVSSSQGSDSNTGTSESAPLHSLAAIEKLKLQPGDVVRLQRGDSWEEKLEIHYSGTPDSPIIIEAYGSGGKPRIKSSNTFSQWSLAASEGGKRIFTGSIPGVLNSSIATRAGTRLPAYYPYKGKWWNAAPAKITDMRDGYFYAPQNKGRFYIRHDSGSPGAIEIGARPYAIKVANQSFIIIRDLSLAGGHGSAGRLNSKPTAHIMIDNSADIHLENLTSTNQRGAVWVQNGSRNVVIDNLQAYGHRTTAVYFWEAGPGNRVENSKVSGSGTLETDIGDRGLVGIYKSPGTIVRGCELKTTGHPSADKLDGAISVVRSPNILIENNHLQDLGGTGILVAIGSSGCRIENNTIDNWCIHGGNFKANMHCEGIRVGGGPRREKSPVEDCRIDGNRIINGATLASSRAAIKVMDRPTSGLEFSNNEIRVQNGTLAFYTEASPSSWTVHGNNYQVSSTSSPVYRIADKVFQAWEIDKPNLGRLNSEFGLEKDSRITAAVGE